MEGTELIVTASRDVEDRSRVLQQRFTLPRGVRPEQVTSSLTAEGLLIITANRDQQEVKEVKEVEETPGDRRGRGTQSVEQLQPPPGEGENSGGGVFCEENQYKIRVNVGPIKPGDLVIKTVADSVIVELSQEDDRTGSRQTFSQAFKLPGNVRPETVTSTLSGEGILTISAPLPGN